LPELKRQSIAYSDAAREHGLAVELTVLPGHHHFSILDELRAPDGAISRALCKLIDIKRMGFVHPVGRGMSRPTAT
jgi:arylformamidase